MVKQLMFKTILVLFLLLATAACGAEENDQANGSNGNETDNGESSLVESDPFLSEEITLTYWDEYGAAGVSDADVMNDFLAPVMEQYPNITFEWVQAGEITDLIEAGELPDLMTAAVNRFHVHLEAELLGDLSGFIKERNIDLSKLEPSAIDAIERISNEGEINAIPFGLNWGAMLYNQDIFDRFGEEYPVDGMTWNEVFDLAGKLTIMDEGTQYVGISPLNMTGFSRATSQPLMNEQDEPMLATDTHRGLLQLLQNYYRTPGVVQDGNYSHSFLNQNVAMSAIWLAAVTNNASAYEQNGMRWDLVSFPSFENNPGVGRQIAFFNFYVPITNEAPEAAYRAIEVMVGEEAQKRMNSSGHRLTALKDLDIRQQYASDSGFYDGKNLAGIFSVEAADYPIYTPYSDALHSILHEIVPRIVEGIDVNTVLNEAQEKAKVAIEEIKRSQ